MPPGKSTLGSAVIDAKICVLNAELNVIVPPPGTGSGTVFKLVPLTIHWNAVLYEFVPSVTVTWLLNVLGSAANGEMVPVIKPVCELIDNPFGKLVAEYVSGKPAVVLA